MDLILVNTESVESSLSIYMNVGLATLKGLLNNNKYVLVKVAMSIANTIDIAIINVFFFI